MSLVKSIEVLKKHKPIVEQWCEAFNISYALTETPHTYVFSEISTSMDEYTLHIEVDKFFYKQEFPYVYKRTYWSVYYLTLVPDRVVFRFKQTRKLPDIDWEQQQELLNIYHLNKLLNN